MGLPLCQKFKLYKFRIVIMDADKHLENNHRNKKDGQYTEADEHIELLFKGNWLRKGTGI